VITKHVARVIPHHDGSDLYVSNSAPNLGDTVTLKVRVPHSYHFAEAYVRLYEDAEPRIFKLEEKSKIRNETWLQVKVRITNIHTVYRLSLIHI
jgi:alpha-glucosidase